MVLVEVPPERSVPKPKLDDVLEPRWYPSGPVRRIGKLGRISPRMRTMTRQNEVPEINGDSVDKPVIQQGNSRTQDISNFPDDTEDMRAAGAAADKEANNGILLRDAPMYCLKGAIYIFVPVILAIIGCFIYIRWRRQRHQQLTEMAKARIAARGGSPYADRRSQHHRAQLPERPARMPPPPRSPSPIYPPERPRRPPPPPPPPPRSYRGF
ncbi:uncharacterized protein LOC107323587 [Coturnix japonica]|uniref:uncharacterized protein LOC107323587 n=1 Tax=Coturnix japonica TaxID=93934 RepID=UPI000777D3F6|nr:uncharacterized protein LOC107323587 [Coturnix japonica]